MLISEPRVFLLQAVQWRELDPTAGAREEKLARHREGSRRSLSLRKNSYNNGSQSLFCLDRYCRSNGHK